MRQLVIAIVGLYGVSARAELRYAYVDTAQVVGESEEGKAARTRLQREVERKQRELDQKMGELKRLRAELDKQRPMLKVDVADQKERDLQQRFGLLQNTMLRLQDDLQAQQQAAVVPIVKHVRDVVARIAAREHLTLVLERSAIVYGPPALDLTAEVIRALNASNP
jgi:outer membrane protein